MAGKRPRTENDSPDSAKAARSIPAAFTEPAHKAGSVIPLTLTNADGTEFPVESLDGAVFVTAPDSSDAGWFMAVEATIFQISTKGVTTVLVEFPQDNATTEFEIKAMAVCADGSSLFMVEYSFIAEQNLLELYKITRVDISSPSGPWSSTHVAGGSVGFQEGVGADAKFNRLNSVVLSLDGCVLFVADGGSNRVRRIEVSTGLVTTLAGSGDRGGADGIGAAASFNNPYSLALSANGSILFVSCSSNKIRQIDVISGLVTTLAGDTEPGDQDGVGTSAKFNDPADIVLSLDGSLLFVADFNNTKLRQIVVQTGEVSTLQTLEKDKGEPVGLARERTGCTLLLRRNENTLLSTVVLSLPPLVVPPSTLASDFRKTRGDASLPMGLLSFIVGPDSHRIEHIPKPVLAVRSEYFSRMFRGEMVEHEAECIVVPDATPAAFESLISYLISDDVQIDTSSGHAHKVLQLARKYQVTRLELLCLQAIEVSLGPHDVVQLLEAAHATSNERLFAQCRQYVVDHGAEVKRSGGLEELQDFGIAKGLLSDSIDRCTHLEQRCLDLELAQQSVEQSVDDY